MKKTTMVLMVLVLLIQSCVTESQATMPTLVNSPTVPPNVTKIPTHLTTIFPTDTPTTTPTKTTPAIYPSSFNLPRWMSDPQTMILAFPITDWKGNEIISAEFAFLNPLNAETYTIPFPSNAYFYFWQDNTHFGFLSNDLQYIYLLDLDTGQVLVQRTSTESVRLLSIENSPAPLKIRQDPLSLKNFVFEYLYVYGGPSYSLNTDYTANSESIRNDEITTVKNIMTGEIIWESNPSDGYEDVHFLWSPVKNSYLAIVKGKYSNTGHGFPVDDTTLVLFDVETGKIISSNKVDAGRIQWSPDGTKLLYRNAMSNYWNFGIGFIDAPCFFDFELNQESCIWRIPNRPVPDGYSLITTDDYKWSSDGKSIYFTYAYSSPNGMTGDVCNYSLINGSFLCPTNNLSELPNWDINWQYGWMISAYNFSPDGEYIHFCLDSNHPLSDDRSGESKDGLINIEGTNLLTWTSQHLVDGRFDVNFCSFNASRWRPLP